ncbi:hypothetical protein PPERSA_09133 [Pseudocohnilembus persalinus]|uniref:Uncharacterized protein n=1 Tax=Pseudocohnilembus persalinus TaxID=266149 RepID=A0A0V0QWW3_PSEPJ|nr:hypothetical protein PPERSA_09133 [Pseudocohnilembus persalinus]|eukprot:KRX06731.1 hypothetical protein PPERSA_09133 [Pseudocohnilembus persalinus]
MKLTRNLRKFFSTSKQNTLPPKLEDPTFYTENQEKSMSHTGVQSYKFNFNKKEVTIYGLPQNLDSELLQSQYIQELSETAVNVDKSKNNLFQIDPSLHLFEKRKVIKQIQKQTQFSGHAVDDLSLVNPTIPSNIFELDMEPYLLELTRAKEEDIQELYEIIKNKDYEKAKETHEFFNGRNQEILETEEGQKMYEELCQTIQQKIFNKKPDQPYNDYMTLIVLSLLRGNKIILGDVPQLYFRLLLASKIDLPYLREIFKQMLQFQKDNDIQQVEGIYNILMGQIFQQPVDFYLYYLIQQQTFRDDVDSLSCYVSQQHIEPLKIISQYYGEEGFCKTETFQQFMQIHKADSSQTSYDAEAIEKHALLEVIFGTDLWNQSFIVNQFPYISEDYLALTENDKIQIQKIYFTQLQKYQKLKEKILA